MEIRPIDANALQELCNRGIQNMWNTGVAPVSWAAAYADFKNDIDSIPTLTPPNEWISVEERLPEPGDLIVYADNTVWGYQYGICRVCGKEKAFDYWIPLQDPPNNRPPEGEEDT